MTVNHQRANEFLKVSFRHYAGNPDYFGIQPNIYEHFLPAEQVKIKTNMAEDTQEIQWMMPIKNDGSLEEQSKRLLKYLQITKFGMIALQSAFEKIGIKTPADGT